MPVQPSQPQWTHAISNTIWCCRVSSASSAATLSISNAKGAAATGTTTATAAEGNTTEKAASTKKQQELKLQQLQLQQQQQELNEQQQQLQKQGHEELQLTLPQAPSLWKLQQPLQTLPQNGSYLTNSLSVMVIIVVPSLCSCGSDQCCTELADSCSANEK